MPVPRKRTPREPRPVVVSIRVTTATRLAVLADPPGAAAVLAKWAARGDRRHP